MKSDVSHISGSRPSGGEPCCHLIFGEFSGGQQQHHLYGVFGFKGDADIIQGKKKPSQHPRGPLVAVGERMIAGNAKGVGRCQRTEISFSVSPLVARSGKRRLESRRIAHTDWPAVFGQLPVVDCKGKLDLDPDRLSG